MVGGYAQAGVDYKKIGPFKGAMQEVSKQTLTFPNARGVYVDPESIGTHAAIYEYRGDLPHLWARVQEGLGNLSWIAERMYQYAGTGQTYYEGIGIDVILIAAIDLISQGALPVIFTDEVAAGDSDWFQDEDRAKALGQSFIEGCRLAGCALSQGESSSLRYLVSSEPPVKSAPSFSGCLTGIIAPKWRKISGKDLQPGDHVLGVTSSGLHANGVSLVITRAMTLRDEFLHVLPNGRTLGEEALTPIRSYVRLVEVMLENRVEIHALLGGTGGGLAKIAYDKRPFTYHIKRWPQVPPLMEFMLALGVGLEECLRTFNMGVGFYIFVPSSEVNRVITIGTLEGYEILDLGEVLDGERKVIVDPFGGITLEPPGE